VTSRVLTGQGGLSMSAAKCLVLAFLLSSTAAWPREAASPITDKAAAAKHEREASYHVTNVNALLDLLTHVVWSGAVELPKTV